MVASLAAAGVFIRVRAVGGERDGVACAEIVPSVVDVQAQRAAQDDQDFVRPGRVRFGRVRGARGEAELVELDHRRGAGRRKRTALEATVGGPQQLGVAAAKNHRACLRLADELRERDRETDGDFPEHADRGVRLAGLDLRQRGAAYARRAREIVERHAASFASLAEVLGDATSKLGGADVVAQRRERAARTIRTIRAIRAGRTGRSLRCIGLLSGLALRQIGLARQRHVLHYNRHAIMMSNQVNERARGVVVWLTGLSGAGKSTLAGALVPQLAALGKRVELLDGDVVRANLSKGLTFSREDRDTNVARIAFVAHLLARNGVMVVVAAISPFRAAREAARKTIGDFVEVHVAPPLDECIKRDVKGLYAKARSGEIGQFTGVSDPYEEPLAAELTLDTSRISVDEGVARLMTMLRESGYLDDGAGTVATAPELSLLRIP